MKKMKLITMTLSIIAMIGNITYHSVGNNSVSSIKDKKLVESKKGERIIQDKNTEDNETIEVKEENINGETKKVVDDKSTEEPNKNKEKSNLNSEKSNDETQKEIRKVQTEDNSQANDEVTIKQPESIPQNNTQTEWEKLGISEYDYYNSPTPSDGEIAFREEESKCDAVTSEITSKYSFVTHYGDVRSYSNKYLGC